VSDWWRVYQRVAEDEKGRRECTKLEAAATAIRPLLLHGVLTDLFGLPGADVSNLTVLTVVPALSGDGVSHGLTQLMRSGHGERLKTRKVGGAGRTTGERHHGVKNILSNCVVISAEHLA
jgi:hypothetical protein